MNPRSHPVPARAARTLLAFLLGSAALVGCGGDTASEVLALPTITTQPVGVSVGRGAPFTLTVVASNATGYQWFRNGTQVSTSSTYTVTSATANDAGTYYAAVSNANGIVPSNPVTVTVTTSTGGAEVEVQ